MDRTITLANHPAADFNRALQCSSDGHAFDRLLQAAEDGCVRAQFLLGLAYQIGRGIAIDYESAAAWYRKAACSGDGYAIANLGVMGLLRQAAGDDVDAYTWVQSAVGLGHERLRPALEVLERRVTGAAGAGDGEPVLAAISPEIPVFRPCTQPGCDLSRCDVS